MLLYKQNLCVMIPLVHVQTNVMPRKKKNLNFKQFVINVKIIVKNVQVLWHLLLIVIYL